MAPDRDRYDPLRQSHEQAAAELQRQMQEDARRTQERNYSLLREMHERLAAELEKQRTDAQKNLTASAQQQSSPSAEQRQLNQNEKRDAAAVVAAENVPVRPEQRVHLTAKSADIGDVVVQPVMTWRAPQADPLKIEAEAGVSKLEPQPDAAANRVQRNVQAMDAMAARAEQDINQTGPRSVQAVKTRTPPRKEIRSPAQQLVGRVKNAFGRVAHVALKALDGFASLFEGLFGGRSEPKEPTLHEIAAAEHREVQEKKQAEHDALLSLSDEDRSKYRQEVMRQFGRQIEESSRAAWKQGIDHGHEP